MQVFFIEAHAMVMFLSLRIRYGDVRDKCAYASPPLLGAPPDAAPTRYRCFTPRPRQRARAFAAHAMRMIITS